jgi:hypothetical protein
MVLHNLLWHIHNQGTQKDGLTKKELQSVDWSGEQIQTHLFSLLDILQSDMCIYHVYQIFEGAD